MRSDPRARHVREQIGARWRTGNAPVKHLDPVLLAATLLLVVFGLVAIYSAKYQQLVQAGLRPDLYVSRQLLAFVVGVVGLVVASAVDYRRIRAFTPLLYVGAIGLLALVLVVGEEINGAVSWITVGGFQFQPSELAKIAVVLSLAALLADHGGDGLAPVVLSLLIVGPPTLLIVLQPDPGTASVLLFVAFAALLVQGTKGRWLAALVGGGVAGLWAVLQFGLLKDHQAARLTSFLNPGDETLAQGLNYNTDQSLIAIGSGQITGKGLFQGSQTNLAYVPENDTDFIFTVIAEQFGFLGGLLLLALFAVVLYRCLRIAAGARDRFGLVVASSVAALLAFQLFVNVGMAVGIMPVIGIPLPFVSYGGTSLIATLTMVGLVLNVHMRRFAQG